MKTASKRAAELLLFFVLLLGISIPVRAAGSYRGDYQSNGSVNVVNEGTGEVTANLYLPGKSVNPELTASGDKIYFTAYKPVDNYTVNYLYYYDLKKKYVKYLRTLPSGCYEYNCNEVYDGYLYLSGWNPSDNIMLYRCKTSGKNLKKIVGKAGYSKRYKQYVICDPRGVMGGFAPYNVYVYDTKAGRNKNAVKHIASYTQSSRYIYAAVIQGEGFPEDGAYYRIVRYDMVTGQTKVLVKSMKAYLIRKINSKYVWFHTGDSYDARKYYRFTISSLTTKEISKASFEKSCPN